MKRRRNLDRTSLRGLRFQFFDVRHQFVFAGHAAEVETDHLVSSQRWLLTRPQADQQAGDDRAVRLNFDSLGIVAQQVTAAEHVLEESEKYLDRPAMGEDQGNHIRRNVHQVRGDPQHTVTVAPLELPLYRPRVVCGLQRTQITRNL